MAPGINRLKTWVLIAALGGLFVLIGSFWGTNGAIIALILAVVFNFSMYWFSDRIAIATTRSKPVTEQEMPDYYRIVRELTNEQTPADAEALRLGDAAAERVRDGAEPGARLGGRDPGHPADPRRA